MTPQVTKGSSVSSATKRVSKDFSTLHAGDLLLVVNLDILVVLTPMVLFLPQWLKQKASLVLNGVMTILREEASSTLAGFHAVLYPGRTRIWRWRGRRASDLGPSKNQARHKKNSCAIVQEEQVQNLAVARFLQTRHKTQRIIRNAKCWIKIIFLTRRNILENNLKTSSQECSLGETCSSKHEACWMNTG